MYIETEVVRKMDNNKKINQRREKMKRIVSVLLVVLLIFSLISGCTSDNNGTETTQTTASAETTAPQETSDEKIEVAALLYSRAFEFMVALDTGIQNQCAEYGIDVTVLDGNSDSALQISQIEDSITKGVDVILLAPANSEELVAGVKKANDAGIPVVTLDGELGEGAEVLASVTFDNHAGGFTAAETLMSLIESTTVLECEGASGAYHSIRRGGGFKDGMATDSSYKVISNDCQWDAEVAQNATADVLTSNENVKAVFTHNGEMVRGVIAGLKQIGMLHPAGDENHITVVSVDGTPNELDYIREGSLDACIEQNPFDMGALAVKVAYEYLTGSNTSPEYQQYVHPRVITAENVEDPENWANQIN
jgi:ribose transport system substrate-binding protein